MNNVIFDTVSGYRALSFFFLMQSLYLLLLRVFRGRPCSGPLSLHLAPSRAHAAGCRRAGQRIGWATGIHCASSEGVDRNR